VKFVVLGAAGQARETEYYLRESGHECVGFVVSDLAKLGPNDSRERVLGEVSWIDSHVGEIDAFALGIGTPIARVRVASELRSRHPRVPWPPIVHPSAVIDRTTCSIGVGSMVGSGAIITVNVVLDEFCMVNFGATIGHDSHVGRGAVINPGANISGGVRIGDCTLVGAGAVVLQYRRIGASARVGAGAVVTRDVDDSVTVVGVPARVRTPD
jgi:sugar O-acyltransferase (sialic acid O-acetyltransferase NeuD family)